MSKLRLRINDRCEFLIFIVITAEPRLKVTSLFFVHCITAATTTLSLTLRYLRYFFLIIQNKEILKMFRKQHDLRVSET